MIKAEENYSDILHELTVIEKQQYVSDKKLKAKWHKELKGQINTVGLFNFLNRDFWQPEGTVDVVLTDEKLNGYPSYQCARIKDDKENLLYLETTVEYEDTGNLIRGIGKVFVWQTTGMTGDDYSGYMLFELLDGKYFKIYYSL